jgi:hypothetical protein
LTVLSIFSQLQITFEGSGWEMGKGRLPVGQMPCRSLVPTFNISGAEAMDKEGMDHRSRLAVFFFLMDIHMSTKFMITYA